MNNADLIVATLKAAGISRGFGIPSGNVLPLMEAMRKGGLDFVLTAHEGSAGFAADVTGRLTGIPGLCIATLGPGATNLATGIGNAWLDRSPMIAITCNLEFRSARPPDADVDRSPRPVQADHQGHVAAPARTDRRNRDASHPDRTERAEGAGSSRSSGRRGVGADQRIAAGDGCDRSKAPRRRTPPSSVQARCWSRRNGRSPSSARRPCASRIRICCARSSSATTWPSPPPPWPRA